MVWFFVKAAYCGFAGLVTLTTQVPELWKLTLATELFVDTEQCAVPDETKA